MFFDKIIAQKSWFRIVSLALAIVFLPVEKASAREQIQIVGSSTVFPFTTVVAERFGKLRHYKTPVVESTGTGGGFKLFCAGLGLQYPDITNASRRIKKSEFEKCRKLGITITEFLVGYDGVVFVNARRGAKFVMSMRDIFLALAAQVPMPNRPCDEDACPLIKNPYRLWSDVNPNLPRQKIEILGPPPTSGTRDAFVELAMEGGAKTFAYYKALKKRDMLAYKEATHRLREDGAWIDVGENDNLLVAKLAANPDALGVFGFSFLDQNSDKIKPATIDGVNPNFDAIASGDYKISRSLFVYVKREHIKIIRGVANFMKLFTEERVFGADGYLVDKGLIPLNEDLRHKMRRRAQAMRALTISELR